MKKCLSLIIFSILLGLNAFSQTYPIVYSATPNPGSPSTFTEYVNSNVTMNTHIGSNFGTSGCTSLPGGTVMDTATKFNDSYERAKGKYLSFKLTPKSGYKIVLNSIGFKISSISSSSILYRVEFSNTRFVDDNYSPNDFTPSTHTCGQNDTSTMAMQTYTPSLNTMGNNNIVDSINGITVRLYFFNAPTATQINIISVQLNGSVVPDANLTDSVGNSIVIGSPLNKAKYSATPTFADEFNTSGYNGNTYNRKDWNPRTGTSTSFGGICTAQSDTIYNGALHIRFTDNVTPNGHGGYDTAFYGGGLISTHNLRYGYYEIKTKLYGATKGLHQSFWCTGNGNTNTSIANDSTSKGTEMSEDQCFEFDSDTTTTVYGSLQPSIWLPGSPNYQAFISQVANQKATIDTNVIGFEYMPDSFKVYVNNKVVTSYAFTDTARKYSMAEAWQLSALPTPKGYYTRSIPLPVSGAEMWVDYFRFYAPVSPNGINFISNCIFGGQCNLPITSTTSHRPAGWINALNYDINQNQVNPVYDTVATSIVSDTFYPDPNNSTCLKHFKASSSYRTSTRQILEAIPNGTYRLTAYVKCSNLSGDSVYMRVRTRNQGASQDTVYAQSINLAKGVADASWRKVYLHSIPVTTNSAVIEFYSNAAANSYTYIDSVVFTGDTVPKITFSNNAPYRYFGDTTVLLNITSSSSESLLTFSLTDSALASLKSGSLGDSLVINTKTTKGNDTLIVIQPASPNFPADTMLYPFQIVKSIAYLPDTIHGVSVTDTIKADNFDLGNNGYAYHVLTTSLDTGYRIPPAYVMTLSTNDTGSNGYKIAGLGYGDSLNYTVYVKNTGTYAISTRTAYSGTTGGTFYFGVDGVDTGYTFTAPNSGYTTFKTTSSSNSYMSSYIYLTQGQHVISLHTPGNSIHFNWFSFKLFSNNNVSSIVNNQALITEDVAENKLLIFPNPIANMKVVNAKVSLINSSSATLLIENLTGKVVYSKKYTSLPSGENKFQLNISGISKGLYFVRLITGNQTITNKFVIE